MSKYVPIRFNDEEEAKLLRSFAVSDDTALGGHIKRVFFGAITADGGQLQRIQDSLEALNVSIERLHRGSPQAEKSDADLLLSIICGLYLMVRKSVGDSVRAQADQVLDVSAIEQYLKSPR